MQRIHPAFDPPHAMTQSPAQFASLLPELTLEEKVALLSGRDFSTAAGVTRLGIPPIRVADSVCGIRPSGLEANITTASFPNTACYGSTWDSELLGRLGEELARQARQKNAQVILGPTLVNRSVQSGYVFSGSERFFSPPMEYTSRYSSLIPCRKTDFYTCNIG